MWRKWVCSVMPPTSPTSLGTPRQCAHWDEFLKVGVVAPSSYEGVNAPETPMAMCGAYSNTRSHEVAQWQNENVKPYTIPMTQKGVYDLTDGKIYLRRPVSQINFNAQVGQ